MATTQQEVVGRIGEFTMGDRLRKAREEVGIKQEEMAEIMGVSPATISNWENSQRMPRGGELDLARRWAAETGFDVAWLLGVRNCWLPPGAPDELPPFEVMGRQITHSATGATHRDAA